MFDDLEQFGVLPFLSYVRYEHFDMNVKQKIRIKSLRSMTRMLEPGDAANPALKTIGQTKAQWGSVQKTVGLTSSQKYSFTR